MVVFVFVMLMVDEIIVEVVFGGFCYCLVNFSKMINFVIMGVGGMDMGFVLMSGFVVFYVIYNLMIGVSVFLGVNVMLLVVFNVYGGGNMLLGYIVLVFVSVWLINGSV